MNFTIKAGKIQVAGESDVIHWQHIIEEESIDRSIYFKKDKHTIAFKCEMFDYTGIITDRVLIEFNDNKLTTYSNKQLYCVSELLENTLSHPTLIDNPIGIVIELLAIDIEHSISLLSNVHQVLDTLGSRILEMDTAHMTKDILEELHQQEEMNSRIRENSIDTHRVVSFLQKSRVLNPEQQEHARLILHDVDSCDTNTSFIFDKVNFLMSNIVSIVNINQSRIIKIFSVVNVALMPPTLVASIYGQNIFFPEISWLDGMHLAYPWTVFLMVLSAVIPMWLFYKKGWLK